jgi:histidine kinase
LFNHIRRHLRWKLFLSYLIVILVGIVVLGSATQFIVPGVFDHHMATMAALMGGASGDMELSLFTSFRNAVNEALALAGLAAFLVAVVLSVLVSRQVVTPVHEMMVASQRVANGHYDERVKVPGNPQPGSSDELAQLAVSFNQMADKLERIEATRRELIGNVAHELRTPLTAVKGLMEGLIDGVLPADASTFQQVYCESDRLQQLVNDLQELSRVEAGTFELHRRAVSVSSLVQTTVARLARQFQEKGVTLEVGVPGGLPPVLADEDRIGQVLLNLVGNALLYTPAGGSVHITARRQADEAQISVVDTGIGISAEHLPLLFTRFYRVDKSRSRAGGGSGIGLTIAKHLVEGHAGHIWAESAGLGQGSTFTFTLPIAA